MPERCHLRLRLPLRYNVQRQLICYKLLRGAALERDPSAEMTVRTSHLHS